MDSGVEVTVVLLLCVVSANLPFVNERLFVLGHRWADKPLAVRLLELLVWAAVCVGLGLAMESHLGQRHPQAWPFYAAMGCLFLTLAFPGFVWRYLRRRRPRAADGQA